MYLINAKNHILAFTDCPQNSPKAHLEKIILNDCESEYAHTLTIHQAELLLLAFKKRKMRSAEFFINCQNKVIKDITTKDPTFPYLDALREQKDKNEQYLKDLSEFLDWAIENKAENIKDVRSYLEEIKILKAQFWDFQVKYSIEKIIHKKYGAQWFN